MGRLLPHDHVAAFEIARALMPRSGEIGAAACRPLDQGVPITSGVGCIGSVQTRPEVRQHRPGME